MSASRNKLLIALALSSAFYAVCTGNVQAQTAGDAARGRKVFSALNCEMCHPGGGNALDPSKPLKGAGFARKYTSDAAIAMLIRNGSQNGGMPAFRRDQLSDQQLCDLIAYLRSLTPTPKPGATKAAPAVKNAAPAASSKTQQPTKRK